MSRRNVATCADWSGVESGRGDVLFQHPTDAASGQTLAETIDEYRRLPPLRLLQRVANPYAGVISDRANRVGTERTDPLLATFTADFRDLFV